MWYELNIDIEKVIQGDKYETLALASLIRGLALEPKNPIANILLYAFEKDIDETIHTIANAILSMETDARKGFIYALETFLNNYL